jgi:S1-C subfamily serine protease
LFHKTAVAGHRVVFHPISGDFDLGDLVSSPAVLAFMSPGRPTMSIRYSTILVLLFVPAFARAADDEKGWLGVTVKFEDGKVIVVSALPESPAEKAKLQENDVIVKVGNTAAESLEGFVNDIKNRKPGDKITLVINRDGKEMEIKITLGKRPVE